MDKLNGLHSGTQIKEEGSRVEGGAIGYHEHPVTKELVIIKTWCVPNGEDDVDYESEVLEVHPPIICQIIKEIENIKNKIEKI